MKNIKRNLSPSFLNQNRKGASCSKKAKSSSTLFLSLLSALFFSFSYCAASEEESPVLSPDLSFTDSSLSSASVTIGAAFSFSSTISNSGINPSQSAELRYYESEDASIDTSDREIGSPNSIAALETQGEESITISLTAPSSLGSCYYGACIVSVFEESNTNNNCSTALMLSVSQLPRLIAVGYSGDSLTSDDNGISWTSRASGTTNILTYIIAEN